SPWPVPTGPCPKPLSSFPAAPLGTGAALGSPLQEPSLVQAAPAQLSQSGLYPSGMASNTPPHSFTASLAGLELSHCVGANSLGPTVSWRSGGPCKMKRVRTVFKPEQLERLEQEFLKQQYMVGTERVDLAATLHLTETQVKVWFQNRRIKWRKQSMEQKAAKLSHWGG
uniref:Uncharacterized protein n=1 Tax=Melopsittacus undulatus TaxID=13146 RepID=A0A8C6J0F0_MELUD